eukprot:1187744-Prorocentrum_minimum.AAC.7
MSGRPAATPQRRCRRSAGGKRRCANGAPPTASPRGVFKSMHKRKCSPRPAHRTLPMLRTTQPTRWQRRTGQAQSTSRATTAVN